MVANTLKITIMKENNLYETPKVELIEVEIEKGFAQSGYGLDSDDTEFGGH